MRSATRRCSLSSSARGSQTTWTARLPTSRSAATRSRCRSTSSRARWRGSRRRRRRRSTSSWACTRAKRTPTDTSAFSPRRFQLASSSPRRTSSASAPRERQPRSSQRALALLSQLDHDVLRPDEEHGRHVERRRNDGGLAQELPLRGLRQLSAVGTRWPGMSRNRVPGRTGRGIGVWVSHRWSGSPRKSALFRHLREECGIERSRRSFAPDRTTKEGNLQDVFYGSDGTRTRDLRRDRPLLGTRRLATMDAQSLYSCGFRGSRPFHSAWLSEAGFRRLVPVERVMGAHRRTRTMCARFAWWIMHPCGAISPLEP